MYQASAAEYQLRRLLASRVLDHCASRPRLFQHRSAASLRVRAVRRVSPAWRRGLLCLPAPLVFRASLALCVVRPLIVFLASLYSGSVLQMCSARPPSPSLSPRPPATSPASLALPPSTSCVAPPRMSPCVCRKSKPTPIRAAGKPATSDPCGCHIFMIVVHLAVGLVCTCHGGLCVTRHASDNAPRVLRLSSPAQSATRKILHHSAQCRRFCADALIAALLHQSLCAYHCQKRTVASIPVSCVAEAPACQGCHVS